MTEKLDLREILAESVRAYRGRLGSVLAASGLISALALGVTWVTGDGLLALAAELLVGVVADAWLAATVVLLVWPVQVARGFGEGLPLGQALWRPARSLAPLIVLTAATQTAVGVGLGLALAPGIFLLTIWLVALPALVVEGTSVMGAWRRSRELTEGHRGKLVWTSALLLVLLGISLGGGLLLDPYGAASEAFSLIAGILLYPFEVIAVTVVYQSLTANTFGALEEA